jgi:hypothetical protein
MNVNKLKAAVKKYSPLIAGKSEDEVRELLTADDKNYTIVEMDKIYEELLIPGNPGTSNTGKSKEVKPFSPNNDLDLSGFDYKALSGEKFEEYNDMVNSLPLYDNKDFTQYMASGLFKKEFDVNLNPVDKLIGIKINNDTPVNHTRIPVHVAIEMNRQIDNRDNPASNSRYYLLKK